jgi:hypothetical protein
MTGTSSPPQQRTRAIGVTTAGHLEVEGIGLRGEEEDAPDIYVEMVADPDASGDDLSNTDIHVSLFHYRGRRR